MLGARCSMLDARCSMLDARCSMLDAWARCSYSVLSTLFASVYHRLNFEVGMSSSCGSASCMECHALWRLGKCECIFRTSSWIKKDAADLVSSDSNRLILNRLAYCSMMIKAIGKV